MIIDTDDSCYVDIAFLDTITYGRSDFSFPTFVLYISLHFNSVYVENS